MSQIGMVVGRPWSLDLPLAGVLPGPQRTKWIDAAFGAMAGLDAPFETKLRVIGLLAQHVLGEARVTVGEPADGGSGGGPGGRLPGRHAGVRDPGPGCSPPPTRTPISRQ